MLASTLQFSHTTHNDNQASGPLVPAGVTVPHTNHQHHSQALVCAVSCQTPDSALTYHPPRTGQDGSLWWPLNL